MTSGTSPSAEVERLAASTYLALITYKKDGTAVATPVWVSADATTLYIWTEAKSGKVKRIRNRGHVMVAPSDSRGRLQGAPVDASARIVDDPVEIKRIEESHKAKYGIVYWVFDTYAKIMRRNSGGHVGIAITVV